MELIKIDESNIEYAIKLQHILFPIYHGDNNYKESLEDDSNKSYYLIKVDNEIVGITGLYFYFIDLTSGWLGWFGILKEYRRKHYGSDALKMIEDLARSKGFKYLRLYTDKYNNDIAHAFYESCGYIKEEYINIDDPASYTYPLYIYSKSLAKNIPYKKWDNKNIIFTKQVEKQS